LSKKTEFGIEHANQLELLFKKFEKMDEKEAEAKRKKKKEQEDFEASIMNSTVHSEIEPTDLAKNSSKILPGLSHLLHNSGPDGP
jgi:hypothetical protein